MPKLATAEFCRDRPLEPGELISPPDKSGLKGMVPVAGILPALVPGMVDAELVALREYGTKSFSEVIEPAIELADGMAIDETRSGLNQLSARLLGLGPPFVRVFHPGRHVPPP